MQWPSERFWEDYQISSVPFPENLWLKPAAQKMGFLLSLRCVFVLWQIWNRQGLVKRWKLVLPTSRRIAVAKMQEEILIDNKSIQLPAFLYNVSWSQVHLSIASLPSPLFLLLVFGTLTFPTHGKVSTLAWHHLGMGWDGATSSTKTFSSFMTQPEIGLPTWRPREAQQFLETPGGKSLVYLTSQRSLIPLPRDVGHWIWDLLHANGVFSVSAVILPRWY